ncbi:MAG TPA: ATP-binding protein [Candidatus Margulisiibacteriota bacterium]|nr:ATP-binding protein [Candidatus Margulisiibacteriota bacterium]
MIPEPEQAAGGTREAVEDIDYPARRELDRAQIRQLANCRWVQEHHNILITGATGTAKTFVACALAHKACRSGHRALYRRASRLFDELTLARADGTYARVLHRVARIDVLIIDDWALAAVHEQERQDLLEILEDRHGTRSPSSPANCRWRSGTPTSATRRWPTPSAIVYSTMPTASC